MKRNLTVAVLLFFCHSLIAQREYTKWFFGNNAAMDFSQGSPTNLTVNAMADTDNPATMSDSLGNILFYSNGISVWNRNHAIMPNGNGLLGHLSGGHTATAVKMPGSDSIYYLFTMDAFAGNSGLKYNIIDMTLDGGLGNIIAGQKNRTLLTAASEQIVPVLHANGRDIWIVTHPWNSSSYHTYLIDCNGLNTTPVVSTIGRPRNGNTNNATGQITVNPANNRIATANWGQNYWELYDFDNSTGQLSNVKEFTQNQLPWGIEFSANGNLLYVSGWTTHYVSQYNLTTYTTAAISASETNLGDVDGPGGPYYTGYMQRAPDGKIYIAVYLDPYLAVINNPDVPGNGCNMVDDGYYLGGPTSTAGLPDKIVALPKKYLHLGNDTTLCTNFAYTLKSNDINTIWSNGSTGPQLTVNTAGTYWARVTDNCNNVYTDTITISVTGSPPIFNLGNDTTVCGNIAIVLNSGINSSVWNTGVTGQQITVTSPGTYWATANNGCGSASDTITITQNNSVDLNLGNDTSLCNGQTLLLDAQNSGATYQWQNGSGAQTYTVTGPGMYSVTVTNFWGCTGTDYIEVLYYSTAPTINLGNDTSLCGNFVYSLNSTYPLGNTWSTGETSQVIYVDTPGTYYLQVNNGCGTTADSITLQQLPLPLAVLGPDTVVCQGQSITLVPLQYSGTIHWSTGSSLPTETIDSPGVYYIVTTENGCSNTDSINVVQGMKPEITLGPDTFICGSQYYLKVNGSFTDYKWQDGSNETFFNVSVSGVYQVTVTNECGAASDDILVNLQPDECAVLVPTAFSPNGDGVNDLFRGICRCPVQDFDLQVYNRWGELVFETTNILDGWNGKYKNVLQPLSVYAYQLSYFSYCTQKTMYLKGNVTLVR